MGVEAKHIGYGVIAVVVVAGVLFGIIVGCDYAATKGINRNPIDGDEVALLQANGQVDITDFASFMSGGLQLFGASDPIIDARQQWQTNFNKMMIDGGAYNGQWVGKPDCYGGASSGYIVCTVSWWFNCDAVIDYMMGTGSVISMFTSGPKETACKSIADKCNSEVVSNFNKAASKSSQASVNTGNTFCKTLKEFVYNKETATKDGYWTKAAWDTTTKPMFPPNLIPEVWPIPEEGSGETTATDDSRRRLEAFLA